MEKIEVGDIFIVTDENDQEQELEVLGTMDVADSVYVAVGFVDEIAKETTGDVDIFFLKVEEDGELSEIETDEEFNEVSAAFEAMVDKEQ
ncbi:DUF1292 domain-containing protein [Sutcliffiella horikoshii]|uniref:DUF1292 domain-containing protein n=1 Tax=Sutcliffiella horikoshii TaxID=79883 RepID=UPI001CBCD83C|nr:DUF1292 domain-containing protein [Sutcliffiella horikoshii]UAL49337.1 DUF1292 domain-containing protein [Sutcliffiella horikoshii]